jgi:type II secretory pathway component PulC
VAAKTPPVVARDFPFDVLATFVETDASECQTILRDKSSHQYLVRNGQTILGFKVIAIREGEIVVNGSGQDATLKVVSQGAAATVPAPAGTVAPQAPAIAAPAPAKPGPVGDMFTVTREQLRSCVGSATELMTQVELAPHQGPGDVVDGLRIVKMAPGSIAAQRGFHEGDIVKVVRKITLTEPRQVPYLAALILRESPPSVEVAIERNGAPMALTYTLR